MPILPEAREILVEMIKSPHEDEDFIFPDMKRLSQRISILSNKLNIPFSTHTLRHTFASRCYAAGVDPKAIQTLLGHESIDTTLNVYVHLLKSVDEELLSRIRDFFIENKIIKQF